MTERSPSERALVEALIKIAQSYDWEPYEEDETIIKSGVVDSKIVYQEFPTNRRIAREVLDEYLIDYKGE